VLLLTSCKPQVVKETETVTVYVPQYKEFDTSQLNCTRPELSIEMTWADALLALSEALDLCVSSVELVSKTLNDE